MRVPTPTDEGAPLLKERMVLAHAVGFFGMILGVLFVGANTAAERPFGTVGDWTALGLVAAQGLGLLASRLSPPRARLLRWIDLGMGVLLGGLLMVHSWYGAEAVVVRFNGVSLAISFALFRATLLPTSPRWTALVSALLVFPVVSPALGLVWPGMNVSTVPLQALQDSSFAMFGVTTVAIATLISKVTFELRRDVRTARRLGSYELHQRVGLGGMGEVYLARHAFLQRPTAIKLLRPDQAGAEAIARFEQEVQLTASLTHPNTVAVYDFGRTADRVFYYAMEWLQGLDLEQIVRRDGWMPAPRVLHILEQVAGSLSEAHAEGLVHRDIKAANVMLCRRGGRSDVVKVVDFGLAKEIEAPEVEGTRPGQAAGTPPYMAPEAWLGMDRCDARTDIYAVGVLGFYLLTGEVPYTRPSRAALVAAHMGDPVPSPSQRLAEPPPRGLEALIVRMLAKKPEQRPADGGALAEELAALRDEVGVWTEQEARQWWRHQGPLGQPSEPAGDPALTILRADGERGPSTTGS